MEFTLMFLKLFYLGLLLTGPILLLLALVVVILGQIAGKQESWSRGEALYWSFVTATTVGYGDFRPLRGLSRILSILIAFCGVVFTGILVAVAISAVTYSLKAHYDLQEIERQIEQQID
jgi:hypothetical protein